MTVNKQNKIPTDMYPPTAQPAGTYISMGIFFIVIN